IAGAALALPSFAESRLSQIALLFCVVSFALAVSPFARLPSTVARFDEAMRATSASPHAPLRERPLVVADLFRGIPRRPATVTRGVPFASPNGTRLTLDVYRPAGDTALHPIIVQIY